MIRFKIISHLYLQAVSSDILMKKGHLFLLEMAQGMLFGTNLLQGAVLLVRRSLPSKTSSGTAALATWMRMSRDGAR
jgi:hypothetical protein